MDKVKFLTRFMRGGPKPKVLCTMEERRTKSEFKDDCDINLIISRYRKTGILPDLARAAAARFGDFSQIPSYQEMQDKLNAAEEMFAALPAKVRKEFDNDPGLFIAAADTEEGRETLKKLGLGKEVDTPLGDSPVDSKKVKGASKEPAPKKPIRDEKIPDSEEL